MKRTALLAGLVIFVLALGALWLGVLGKKLTQEQRAATRQRQASRQADEWRGKEARNAPSNAVSSLTDPQQKKVFMRPGEMIPPVQANRIDTNLPPLIATAVGKGEQQGFRSRLAAIHQLGNNLSAEEKRALYDYLKATGEEKWLRSGQAFALKNDILNVLREQQQPPEELTEVLLALRQDTSQPLVIRDYALQHLAPWFAKVNEKQKELIIKELQAAAREKDQSYAGTALLGLRRIQLENANTKLGSWTAPFHSLLEDSAANLLARITAVQLCGQMNLEEFQSPIQTLATDASQPNSLRLAAIGALGQIGKKEELAFLNDIANGKDVRLKTAALAALNNLLRSKK